jgi:hypothetical protein
MDRLGQGSRFGRFYAHRARQRAVYFRPAATTQYLA